MTDLHRKIEILEKHYPTAYLVGYIESLEKELNAVRKAVGAELVTTIFNRSYGTINTMS
jgi:hypothetical protein